MPRAHQFKFVLAMVLCLSWARVVCAQASAPDLPTLELEFETKQASYLAELERYLPGAYRERFTALTDAQLSEIAQTRRLWQHYTLTTSHLYDFQKQFLDPINRVAELLLIDPAAIEQSPIKLDRAEVMALGKRLDAARQQAGINIDPTVGKQSPTGIAFPPLDQPHTSVDKLLLLERTLVLACTVAPPEARRVLMENAKRCAEIDVQEAGFVMYGNQVRMLTGTVAWVADPITTACARDHSVDRKAGRASGHSSTVPGKEGFGDRLKRFGAKGSSEGAGGGKTGEAYIRGLSYGGGHTGPLYSLKRNAVGPGRAEGAFTSIYYTDQSMLHECQATSGELFLPPGVTKQDIRSRVLRAGYTGLFKQQYNQAYKSLYDSEPVEGFEGAIHRYLRARLDAEVQWTLMGIEQIDDAGDVAEAFARFQAAKSTMQGIPAFDEKLEQLESRFSKVGVAEEIKVGQLFRRICAQEYTAANMKKLIEMHPDSVYAKAAQKCIDDGMPTKDASDPLHYFVTEANNLNRWAYLVDLLK